MIKISPASGKRHEILKILSSVRGPTLAAPGCVKCSIYEEHEEERAVFYLEEWQTWGEMISHLQSPLYARVLKSLELSCREPEICFYETAGTHGMELIESVRLVVAMRQ